MNVRHTKTPFTTNQFSPVDHNPQFIRFSYWSTFISSKENPVLEYQNEQKTIYLKNYSPGSLFREGVIDNYICIRNNCNASILNFNIYSNKARKTVLKLPELPDNKSIRLEFKKEGIYEFHFFIAGSISFSKFNFHVFFCTKTSQTKKIDWNLKPFR